MNRLLTVVLACLFLPAPFALAATLTIQPSKDDSLIQVASVNPVLPSYGQLSNGQGDIFVGRTNQDGQSPATISIRRGLIAFDVAGSIPAGAIITSATLTMRDVQGLNGDRATGLHRTLADWGEGSSFFNGGQGGPAAEGDATWFYRFFSAADPLNSAAWTTPGGDFNPVPSASSIISDDLGGGQLFSWTSALNPQMLADVQSWLTNPTANFGWTLVGVETSGQTAKRFNSGESTAAPNMPPQLSIEYVLIPEPSGMLMTELAMLGLTATRGRRRAK